MPAVPYISLATAQSIMDNEFPAGGASGSAPGAITEQEIWAASKDIDDLALRHIKTASNEGLKVLPTDYDDFIQGELGRAVVAQIAYRRRHGSSFFVEDQYEEVSTGNMKRIGQLSLLSPRAQQILSSTGLLAAPGRIVTGEPMEGVRPVYSIKQPLFPWMGRGWR